MWAGTEKWRRKMSGAGKKRLFLAEMREIEAKTTEKEASGREIEAAGEPESLFSNAYQAG
jgi:hypothetical protein